MSSKSRCKRAATSKLKSTWVCSISCLHIFIVCICIFSGVWVLLCEGVHACVSISMWRWQVNVCVFLELLDYQESIKHAYLSSRCWGAELWTSVLSNKHFYAMSCLFPQSLKIHCNPGAQPVIKTTLFIKMHSIHKETIIILKEPNYRAGSFHSTGSSSGPPLCRCCACRHSFDEFIYTPAMLCLEGLISLLSSFPSDF